MQSLINGEIAAPDLSVLITLKTIKDIIFYILRQAVRNEGFVRPSVRLLKKQRNTHKSEETQR